MESYFPARTMAVMGETVLNRASKTESQPESPPVVRSEDDRLLRTIDHILPLGDQRGRALRAPVAS